ncbi:MAG: hypothetical protein HQ519_01485, partial [Planctomycetes bacterium]|nr:hypothetical protein [Planctomycetota bacterium]
SVLYRDADADAIPDADAAAISSVRIIRHGGSDGTLAYAWPDRDLILCMFTQSCGMSLVHRFEVDIQRLLLAPETNTPPPVELAPLLGYYWDEEGQAEVKFYQFEGALAASHPKVPVPLKFI